MWGWGGGWGTYIKISIHTYVQCMCCVWGGTRSRVHVCVGVAQPVCTVGASIVLVCVQVSVCTYVHTYMYSVCVL